MTDISNTCIGFKSNLQVVIDDKTYSYDKDKHFLASIHDSLALNLMKEHGINFVNAQSGIAVASPSAAKIKFVINSAYSVSS